MEKLVLLLTIICTSVLNGMDPTSTEQKTKELEVYQSLAAIPELQKEIIAATLAISNTPDEAIHMIEKLSILRGIKYDNLKNFATLINVIAKKFPNITRQEIAQKFTLPIAQEYVKFNDLFMHNITRIKHYRPEKSGNALHEVTKLLDDIDPNYSRISPNSSPDNPMQETALHITFNNYINAFSNGYTFINHPHLILIISALIHKGAQVDAELIKKAQDEALENPTKSNLQLLKLLTQANT